MNKVKKSSSLFKKQMIMGYLLIVPAYVFHIVFFVICVGQAISFSFLEWDGISKKVFVGLQNYIALMSDKVFLKAFINNIYYTIGILVFGVIPGMILAYLLSLPRIKGRAAFRAIYFIPRIITAGVYGVVWKWIYDPRNGLAPRIISLFTDESISILGSKSTAMLGITITGGWTYFGFCMVIFLAAFMSIDNSIRESALLDGANKMQTFFHVTLPQIKPVLNTVLIYTVIDSFKVYDLVVVMTGGGPDFSTQIMTYYIFREAFRMDRVGYATASSIMLGIFMVIFTVAYYKTTAKEEMKGE